LKMLCGCMVSVLRLRGGCPMLAAEDKVVIILLPIKFKKKKILLLHAWLSVNGSSNYYCIHAKTRRGPQTRCAPFAVADRGERLLLLPDGRESKGVFAHLSLPGMAGWPGRGQPRPG